ncbi:probable inactive purple acid phosphatase 16 isoform X1 [Amborella trichopoda]|uniref:probable inactive purple acid phosphatase 16 isoform X1 n=1 Tax=Amborella trichopoda TaxID=13333 RepID=UPI0009C05592|nr:probable inactive purple acid phosphatase 16 isoform X1 [Amborella trichopoda]|eukprot:XP_011622998.2 probable inactive purple acid phosphatase 16 isoform X1 [Amborella trichopoda]
MRKREKGKMGCWGLYCFLLLIPSWGVRNKVWAEKEGLKFSQNSELFRVGVFADLHFGEDAWTDWGPSQDIASKRVMSNVLNAEKPDLVVYLGDLVTANNVPISNASAYWEEAISPTRERGIPWASIFGNHDDMPFEWPTQWFSTSGMPPIQCPHKCLHLPSSGDSGCYFQGTTRKELMENDSCNPQSMSSSGPHSLWPSVSNYALPVESSRKPGLVVALLYFLDSGGGTYPEIVSFAQATWFEQISQKLNPDLRIPEIVFWHIPSKAYKKVAPRWGIRKPCIGSINLEKVASQEAEMGMMDVIAKRPSVKAVFAGHNHGLDWCCPYQKLWLCFARHSGYGGYGNWPRGARMIQMTEMPFSLTFWIRMEDGSTHSNFTLYS